MKKVGGEKIFKQSVTKYSLYYNPFYGMVIQKLFQSWKTLTVQKSFLKSMDVLVATKKGLGHVFERKKDVKRFGGKDHLTDAKIDTLQNYFDIAMRQTLGSLTKWFPHARHLSFMLLAIMTIVRNIKIRGASTNRTC